MPESRLTAHGLNAIAATLARATPAPDHPAGGGRLLVSAAGWRSLHFVLERERPGLWRAVFKAAGFAAGKAFGVAVDRELAGAGRPAAAALPLPASLALVEYQFAAQGWGRLTFDLDDASHGVVIARLEHSPFAGAIHDAGFVDVLPAGFLAGFFEHATGRSLGCEELACAGAGGDECIFALADPAHLAAIAGAIGRESVDALRSRLRSPRA